LAEICLVVDCTFYLSLILLLSNLNFELLMECFMVMSFVSLAFARERKNKKNITSLSRITPFNNECILICAFAFPPPLLPPPPVLSRSMA
jgi:hypothetical protein